MIIVGLTVQLHALPHVFVAISIHPTLLSFSRTEVSAVRVRRNSFRSLLTSSFFFPLEVSPEDGGNSRLRVVGWVTKSGMPLVGSGFVITVKSQVRWVTVTKTSWSVQSGR